MTIRYSYDRVYSLTIGLPPEYRIPELDRTEPQDLTGNTFVDDPSLDFRAVEVLRAVEIRSLQMQADISFSSESRAGNNAVAEIKIYNASPQTINIISKHNNFVILKAGYRDDLGDDENYDQLPLIFSGQVISSETFVQGPDVVTVLQCKDGYTPSYGIKLSLSVVGDISYEDVFNAVIAEWKKNGVATSDESIILNAGDFSVRLNPSDIKPMAGWNYEGYIKDCMDELCDHFNFTWYIINNILFIHPKNFTGFVGRFVFSNRNIKEIRQNMEAYRQSSNTQSASNGVIVTTFLNGRITLGKQIEIPDGRFEGVYAVKGGRHVLDWRGNSWDTIIEAEVVTE